MEYNPYSDQLLAGQETLPADTIFKILLGCSLRELNEAEIAEPRLAQYEDPKFRKKLEAILKESKKKNEKERKEKVEEAKQEAGSFSLMEARKIQRHTIVREPQKTPWEKEQELISAAVKTSTPERRVAGRAYVILYGWMGQKFKETPYNTKEFFGWIIEDNILGKLEDRVGKFKRPKRAKEFISYFSNSSSEKTGIADSPKKEVSGKRHAESKEHMEQVREIARTLWDDDDTLTIQDIIYSDVVNSIKKSTGENYAEATIRKWIKQLAPSNKPGRRIKKK